jgi:hypothetical protein
MRGEGEGRLNNNSRTSHSNASPQPILVHYQPPPSHIYVNPQGQSGMKSSGESNAKSPLYPNNSATGQAQYRSSGERGKLYNSVDSLRLPSSLSNSGSGGSGTDSTRGSGSMLPRSATTTEYSTASHFANSEGSGTSQFGTSSYDPSLVRETQTLPSRMKASLKEYQVPVVVAPPPQIYQPSSSLAPLRPTNKNYEQEKTGNARTHVPTTGGGGSTMHNLPQPFALYPNEGESVHSNHTSDASGNHSRIPLRQSNTNATAYAMQHSQQLQYQHAQGKPQQQSQGGGRHALNLGSLGGNATTGGQSTNPLRSPRTLQQGPIGGPGLSPRQMHAISPRARGGGGGGEETSKTDVNSAIDDYNRSLASTTFTLNLTPLDSNDRHATGGGGGSESGHPEENFTAIFSPRRKKDKGVSPRVAVNYSEGPKSPRAGYSPRKY